MSTTTGRTKSQQAGLAGEQDWGVCACWETEGLWSVEHLNICIWEQCSSSRYIGKCVFKVVKVGVPAGESTGLVAHHQ